MSSYLLQESGSKLVLEDGTGDLLLEISVPATSAGDDTWYTYAYAARTRKRPKAPRPNPPKVPHVQIIVDPDDWTDEDLAFLLALDILA